MKRLLLVLGFAFAAVVAEVVLLHVAATHDVSMSLLAGGGALPPETMLLGLGAIAVRMFVRLIVPGLVVSELAVVVLRRRTEAHNG